MALDDYRMPDGDFPVTRDSFENPAPAPEDQPLPPEETAPGAYIYTPVRKRSFKNFRRKLTSMYAAAGLAVLILTNIIPLYHARNEVLPSGNLKILSVLTAFGGWQDEEGRTLTFKENGVGYTWNETGFFGQLRYTGGEEGVNAALDWACINGGRGEVSSPEKYTIDNDNLKADGDSYVLLMQSDDNTEIEFRPVNFLSLNTKYIENFCRYGIRALFPDTEWFARRGGEEPLDPGTVYTETLRLGAADPYYEESRTIFAEGLLDVWSDSQDAPDYKLDPADRSYKILFREGEEEEFEHTFCFHIDQAQEEIRAHVYDALGEMQELTDRSEHFDGVVLVSEDGYVITWNTPFNGWRSYEPISPVLPPDERDAPKNPDETEVPTEEPLLVDDVRKALVEAGFWQSDEGEIYAFREDGTGWVYSGGFFGIMSFEDAGSNVDYEALISVAGEVDPGSPEKQSYTSKNQYFGSVSPYDFFEEDGILSVYLNNVTEGGITAFRAAGPVGLNTEYLDLFLSEGFDGLNRSGYWLITEDWIPESMYPTPYTEFISFSDAQSGLFVIGTNMAANVTSDISFGFSAGQVDPMTIETSLTGPVFYSYTDSAGSSYTHTQEELDGFIRLLIKEDGFYVYANVPLSYPSIYKYTED